MMVSTNPQQTPSSDPTVMALPSQQQPATSGHGIIRTHTLRRATSMPFRRPYELDAPPPPPSLPQLQRQKLATEPIHVPVVKPSVTEPRPRTSMGTSSNGNRTSNFVCMNNRLGLSPVQNSSSNSLSTSTSTLSSGSMTATGATTANNIELLFSHPHAKIISFTTKDGSQKELIPFTNLSERTIAVGLLRLYKTKPHNVAFIQSGSILRPLMPKSQCWCVDEERGEATENGSKRGIFVLKVRMGFYWRLEVEQGGVQNGRVVERLKKVLKGVLGFERDPCPFERVLLLVDGDEEEEKGNVEELLEEKPKQVVVAQSPKVMGMDTAQASCVNPATSLKSGSRPQDRERAKSPIASRRGSVRSREASPLPIISPVFESFDDIFAARTLPQSPPLVSALSTAARNIDSVRPRAQTIETVSLQKIDGNSIAHTTLNGATTALAVTAIQAPKLPMVAPSLTPPSYYGGSPVAISLNSSANTSFESLSPSSPSLSFAAPSLSTSPSSLCSDSPLSHPGWSPSAAVTTTSTTTTTTSTTTTTTTTSTSIYPLPPGHPVPSSTPTSHHPLLSSAPTPALRRIASSSLLLTQKTADLVLVKPSSYIVNMMLRIASRVVSGAYTVGEIECGPMDLQEMGLGAGGGYEIGEWEDEEEGVDDFGFGIFRGVKVEQ
ncbi:inheritance of peroxisomes protein 1-domain-containing protein [Kalaharituber pfeilii]|nr:inheritance of peroxisomes protein 1-domain-containing protein [Kalaharituber pfeilii]